MSPKKSLKKSFLETIPTSSIERDDDKITIKCKFNFSYFTVVDPGIDFDDLTELQCKKLFNKIKEYSRESLQHWTKVPHGNSFEFVVYGDFPKNSDFRHPIHVPHQAKWSRFRLEGDFRLIGFVIPEEFHGKRHNNTGETYDSNTFYLVFLDPKHNFYK